MSIKPARIALALTLAAFVAGCASNKPTYQPAPFTPATIPTGDYVPRVDAFALVMDTSSSMADNRHSDFFAAKDVVGQLNRTIPELGYQGALVTFGSGCMMDKGLARVWYGPETYSTAALGDALASITCAGGPTPMELGIEAGGGAATDTTGQVAVIVVSDFEDIDTKAAAGAIADIKQTYGDRVCLHAIQVGNNAGGADDRAAVAGGTSCGSAVSASELGSPAAMAAYVERVLLAPAPKSNDDDGDGVANADDRCPGTPAGANVNLVGCWWVGADDILFDFDKAEIKSTLMLDEAVEVLKVNPDVNVEVQGHTDNVGDPDYNVGLSERRANAVRDYMISKGIPSSRLRAKGYGMTRPHVSNDSEQGRALNRRVELHPYR